MVLNRLLPAVVAVMLVVGCSSAHPATNRHGRKASIVENWCRSRQEPVKCLKVAEDRHAVVVRAQRNSRGLVFWDPGGPGLGLPDAQTPLSALIPKSMRQFDVVFLIEPWVEEPPSRACLRGATSSDVPSDSCRLGNLFTPDRAIMSALSSIREQLHTPIVGAYLQSFGATRAQSIVTSAPANDVKWVVLESPGPLQGTPAVRLMQSRTAATIEILTAECPDVTCRTASEARLYEWATRGIADSATGREIALGTIALVGLPRQNSRAIRRYSAALRSGRMTTALSEQLRRLGRSYELRGTDVVRASLVALWADTCPRLSGWSALRTSSDPLVAAFGWVFRGCRLAKTREFPVAAISVPVLILTGRRDAVVPPEIQRAWLKVSPGATRISGDEHFWDSSETTQKVEAWAQKLTTTG